MAEHSGDWRNIRGGWEIPTETYADQPYLLKTDDGAWLCVMTTGAGPGGAGGTARGDAAERRQGANVG